MFDKTRKFGIMCGGQNGIKYEQGGHVVRGYVCTRCIRTGSVKKVV